MNDEELYHHGIPGQKWGARNGPPYPLKSSQKSYSERKNNSLIVGGTVGNAAKDGFIRLGERILMRIIPTVFQTDEGLARRTARLKLEQGQIDAFAKKDEPLKKSLKNINKNTSDAGKAILKYILEEDKGGSKESGDDKGGSKESGDDKGSKKPSKEDVNRALREMDDDDLDMLINSIRGG